MSSTGIIRFDCDAAASCNVSSLSTSPLAVKCLSNSLTESPICHNVSAELCVPTDVKGHKHVINPLCSKVQLDAIDQKQQLIQADESLVLFCSRIWAVKWREEWTTGSV